MKIAWCQLIDYDLMSWIWHRLCSGKLSFFAWFPQCLLAALSCELAWSRSDLPQPENVYGESERLELAAAMLWVSRPALNPPCHKGTSAVVSDLARTKLLPFFISQWPLIRLGPGHSRLTASQLVAPLCSLLTATRAVLPALSTGCLSTQKFQAGIVCHTPLGGLPSTIQ